MADGSLLEQAPRKHECGVSVSGGVQEPLLTQLHADTPASFRCVYALRSRVTHVITRKQRKMVGKRAQTPVSKRWPGCLDVERISPETRDQRRILLCEDGVHHAGDANELLPPRRRVWLEPVDADDVSEACLRRGSKESARVRHARGLLRVRKRPGRLCSHPQRHIPQSRRRRRRRTAAQPMERPGRRALPCLAHPSPSS